MSGSHNNPGWKSPLIWSTIVAAIIAAVGTIVGAIYSDVEVETVVEIILPDKPTETPTLTRTKEPTETSEPTETPTRTPKPTVTLTPEPTATDTPIPTNTPIDTPEPTPTSSILIDDNFTQINDEWGFSDDYDIVNGRLVVPSGDEITTLEIIGDNSWQNYRVRAFDVTGNLSDEPILAIAVRAQGQGEDFGNFMTFRVYAYQEPGPEPFPDWRPPNSPYMFCGSWAEVTEEGTRLIGGDDGVMCLDSSVTTLDKVTVEVKGDRYIASFGGGDDMEIVQDGYQSGGMGLVIRGPISIEGIEVEALPASE
jgi:hypothetical protein